jgi:hypothetical protein
MTISGVYEHESQVYIEVCAPSVLLRTLHHVNWDVGV